MEERRGGRRLLRPSFHLYLLTFTLTIFFAQVPLGLFAAQSPLDSTAHVLLPAAATSLLYDAFYHRVVHSPAQYFCTMVLLGVSTEMFWEVLEFGGDAALGLSLAGRQRRHHARHHLRDRRGVASAPGSGCGSGRTPGGPARRARASSTGAPAPTVAWWRAARSG